MRDRDLLNVECCVEDIDLPSAIASDTARSSPLHRLTSVKLEDNVQQWLRDRYAVLEIGQRICPTAPLEHVLSIDVVDLLQRDNHGAARATTPLADVELQIHTFRLHNLPATALELRDESRSLEADADEDIQETETLHAQVTMLPNVDLHGAWESLVFDDPINTRLLRFLMRISESRKGSIKEADQHQGSVHIQVPARIKVEVLQPTGVTTKLIDLDAAALFSKFFGESSKLVSRMFAKIEKMLDEEPNIFLCVMVDEIESLAGRRQHSTSGNEPKDSMRDSAILDRIDVKQYLPGPSTKMRYEILRRCYLDLLSCSIIVSNQQRPRDDEDVLYNAVGDRSLETWDVVPRPLGLSGRVLQRLPVQALAMHIHNDPCSIDEAFDALSRMVEEQQLIHND
ncbi:MAG: hypothetical protein Q9173_001231 [Seirophora scorigena]